MARYAAFLRGINVNGISIKMADLSAAFARLGLEKVRTVLASGNVLFESDETDVRALKGRIEAGLRESFGYEARVVLLDLPTLRRIVDASPFEPEKTGWHAYVLLSSDAEALGELLAVRGELNPAAERIEAGEGVLYWEVERGQTTDSLFGKHSAKARFRAVTTTRNLRTLRKLL